VMIQYMCICFREVRKCGALLQEVVEIFEKISYNLNSPCKGK
jgi:hypothetical protein